MRGLEKQVFGYVMELSGGKPVAPYPTSQGVWFVKLEDGTTINVRSVSSSNVGRWTVDVIGNPELMSLGPKFEKTELKFK